MNVHFTYVQLSNMYAPSWGYGGPVRLMYDYARWLQPISDTLVFSGDLHHDFSRLTENQKADDTLPLCRCRIYFPKLAKRSIYLVSPLMFACALRAIRKTTGPVILHLAEFRGAVPLYATLLKRMFGDRVLLVHSAFGMLHEKAKLHRTLYDLLFMRLFLKNVDIRLAQNQHEYEVYEGLCQTYSIHKKEDKSAGTVLFPLHVDRIQCVNYRFAAGKKDIDAVKRARNLYGIPTDALIFIFLGRIHPEKGLIRLVNVFCDFCDASSVKALLLIVGRDDGFQSQLESYVEQRGLQAKVRIVNNVYKTRFDYYFLADIFLGFPTIFEETMLASIEALACGTPIVVSREADIPFVEEEGAGMVIDFSPEAAVRAMLLVANNLESFQLNARSTVEKHFQAEPAAKNLTRIFCDRIEPARLPPNPVASETAASSYFHQSVRE